jgi:hypothetical protein
MATELQIKITADLADLREQLRLAKVEIAALKSGVQSAGVVGTQSVGGLQGALAKLPPGIGAAAAGFIGVGAAVAAITSAVQILDQRFNSFLETGDRLTELSEKTGLAVEELSGLAYAADQSDTSLDALATGLKKLSINLDAADEEGKKAVDMFARLGISTKDTEGKAKTLSALLPEIANKFASIESPVQKTAIATALFSREGQALVPLLSKGAAGIKELTDKAEQLGIVMGTEAAEAADRLKDKLSTFDQIKTVGFNNAFADAAPNLEKLIDLLSQLKIVGGNGDLLGGIIGSGADAITDTIEGVRAIGAAFEPIIDLVTTLTEALGQSGDQTSEVANSVSLWRAKLEATALEVAGIIDLLQKTFGVVQGLGAVIISAIVYPFGKALELAGQLANQLSAGSGDGMVRAGQAAAAYTAQLRDAAKATIANADAVENLKRKITAQKFDEVIRQQDRDAAKNTPKPAANGALGGSPKKAAGGADQAAQAKQISDSQFALTKATLEAEQKLLEDALKTSLSAYDAAYKDGLVSLDDYYTARESIERERLAGILRIRQSELAAGQAREADANKRKDKPAALRAQAEVVKLQAEVQLAQGGLANLANQIEQAKRTDQKLLQALTLKVNIELAQLQGISLDRPTIEADLRDQMKDLFTKFATDPVMTAKLEKLVTIKADTSQFKERLSQLDLNQRQAAQPVEAQSALINARQQNGSLSQPRAQQQLEVIKAGQVQQLQAYRAQLQELRATLDQGEQSADKLQQSLDLYAKINTVGISIESLKAPVMDFGVVIENTLGQQLTSGLEQISAGSIKTAADFEQMGKRMLASIAQVIVKLLLMKAIEAVTGFKFADGGAVGGALKLADGGGVHGPGGPRDDVIPALLSNGEHVIDVKTVNSFGGHSFFNAMRAIGQGKGGAAAASRIMDSIAGLGLSVASIATPANPRALRLADGGAVPSIANAQSQAMHLTQNFNVSGAADQRTQSQVGAAAFNGARRATMRNG